MSDMAAQTGVKKITMEAVVIRADGTREDLGVIAEWHKNPVRRWYAAFKKEIASWRP